MVGGIGLPATVNTNTLVTLKADPVAGDAGTGAPNNGAAANDPAWPTDWRVLLKDGSYANWNGTAWVVATIPTFK